MTLGLENMKEKQKLDRRNTYTAGNAPHRKSSIIKGVETKLNINTEKVKLVKYVRGLRFATQFLPTFSQGVSQGV
ncbi:hypothetical protein [Ferroplasma sp. Type II]|uniref:hypothetical protein n=1 Tax=Ferroplasma sp. Type II TaxID=261388 RepID=UPI001800744D|nr:hypothetical protein [Ferroplasma sp. Type II]HIH59852.1 hypothetical protein [Ferroplasma sp.]HII82710.1 hypothetical protein [Ferroplasma sp.]